MAGIGVIIVVHQLPKVLGHPVGRRVGGVATRLDRPPPQPRQRLVDRAGRGHAGRHGGRREDQPALADRAGGRARRDRARHAACRCRTTASSSSARSRSGLPGWRLSTLSAHAWGVVVTTSLTLLVVIISPERGDRSLLGGRVRPRRQPWTATSWAWVSPTSSPGSPAPSRSTPARRARPSPGLAGGRTKMVGLVAVVGAVVLSPLATYARDIPLAVLAGVLIFVAARLFKVPQLEAIWRTSRVEFAPGDGQLPRRRLLRGGDRARHRRGAVDPRPDLALVASAHDRAGPAQGHHELGADRAGVSRAGGPRPRGVLRRVPLLRQRRRVPSRGPRAARRRTPTPDTSSSTPWRSPTCDYTGLATLAQVVADLNTRRRERVGRPRQRGGASTRSATSRNKALRHVHFFDSVDAAANHERGKSD